MSDNTHIDDYLKSRLASRVHAFNPAHWEQAEALILDQQRKKRRRFLLWFWFGLGALPILLMGMGVLLYPSMSGEEENSSIIVAQNVVREEPGQQQEIPNIEIKREEVNLNPLMIKEKNEKLPGTFSTQTDKVRRDKGSQQPDESEAVLGAMKTQNPSFEIGSRGVAIKGEEPPLTGVKSRVLGLVKRLKDRESRIPTYLNYGEVEGYNLLNPEGKGIHRLGWVAGIQLSPDFGGDLSEINRHPVPGLQYTFEFRQNWALNVGLNYAGRAGLHADSVFTRRDFGFGYEEERILRSPARSHQVELPIGLSFRVRNRHYLTMGTYASWLLDVSGKEATSLRTELGDTPVGEENVWGLRQGFRRGDLGGYLGYKAYMGRGFFLGAQVMVGSRDWTENSFYQQKRFDRHWGLRLSLSHDLWRR